MKMLRWVIFSLGCVMLIAAYGIGWANWGKLANQIGVMQFLMGAIGVTFSVLVIVGILSRGMER